MIIELFKQATPKELAIEIGAALGIIAFTFITLWIIS